MTSDDITGKLGLEPDELMDHPHADRLMEVTRQRVDAMKQWGVLFHTVGPEHEVTIETGQRIDTLGDEFLRLFADR